MVKQLNNIGVFFHALIGTALCTGGLLHLAGISALNKTSDLIALPTLLGLGNFPAVPDETSGWTTFFINLTIVVGILYYKCAFTKDAELAGHLVWARFSIAVLNTLSGLGITGTGTAPSFWSFTAVEYITVFLQIAGLASTDKAKKN
jgi:hypothetical protein